MAILPNNTDPSKDYVTPGPSPAFTQAGLVYNQIYAQVGVVDSLSTTKKTGYTDPNKNIINGLNNTTTFDQVLQTSWISSPQIGGDGSAPVVLTYNLSTTTYYNNISFFVLNTPCFVEIGYFDSLNNWNALPGVSTYIIAGGSDIFTTTDWTFIQYQAPTTQTATGNLAIRITRNKNVQTNDPIPANIAYSIGVDNFSIKLQVLSQSDVPTSVISGTSNIIAQNRFGFIENYSYSNNPVSNMFTSTSGYWKSAPQPTADSIVYFYAAVSSNTPKTINRLYINPIYSNCKFNVYYTTDSGDTDPGYFTWTPVQRDFVLRRGIYDIPNISCTYLKFEFTQLIPETYDLPFDIVQKTINVFPADVEEYYSNIEESIIDGNSVQYSSIGNNNNPQTATSTNINTSTLFGTASNTIANQNTWPQLSALNASQLSNSTTMANNTNSYVVDPTTSYKLLDANGRYNNSAYNQFLQRRFPYAGTHTYTQVNINQTWHQAYFTGIENIAAFYENQYDDIRSTPNNLYSNNGTTSGFLSQDVTYIELNPDDTALTKWSPTIDTFKSFNIAALTSDWNSFLTDAQVLMNDDSVLSPSYYTNAVPNRVGSLGTSSIVAVSQTAVGSGLPYSVRSSVYPVSTNQASYTDANFLTTNNWTMVSGTTGTTITPVTVTLLSGTNVNTSSGISISGNSYTVAYNFTIPSAYSASGTTPWTVQLGSAAYGVVGYGSYSPVASGINFYFYTGVQVSGNATGIPQVTTTVTGYTQFINPNTGLPISGTTTKVNGSSYAFVSGTGSNIAAITGTNFTNYPLTSGMPSNTIQFVISGTVGTPYDLYQFGIFPTPTSTWISPQDRKNMRVGGDARIFLPFTSLGTYRVSLFATNPSGSIVELTHKLFTPGSIPLNTWFDVEMETFTGDNYTNFYVQVQQTNGSVNETFYLSMLSPFYHPIRFEYTTFSGSTYPNNYQFVTGNINNPAYFVGTISGAAASGIQLKMTALDPGVFISGVSVVPYYKQSPYYAELDIDYIGSSKTNEISSRRSVANKPYFQLNKNIYPERFSIPQVVGLSTPYITG